jgi:hypothetical protein
VIIVKNADWFEKDLAKHILELVIEKCEEMEGESLSGEKADAVVVAAIIRALGVISANADSQVPLDYFIYLAHEMKKVCDGMQRIPMPKMQGRASSC